MKRNFLSRRSHGTALLCGLLATSAATSAAAETLVYGTEETEAWSRTADADSDPYALRRTLMRAGAAGVAPAPERDLTLPPASVLTQRPGAAPQFTYPAAEAFAPSAPPPAEPPMPPPQVAADEPAPDHAPPPELAEAAPEPVAEAAAPAPFLIPEPPAETADAGPGPLLDVTPQGNAPLPWQAAAAPSSYSSPGIIIKKEVVHLDPPPGTEPTETPGTLRLAELMPAAGEAGTMTPLIEAPDAAVPPPPVPPPPPGATPPMPTPTPSPEAAAAPEPPAETPAPAEEAALPPVEMPVTPVPDAAPPADAPQEPVPEAAVEAPEPKPEPEPAPAEPPPQLSEESKEILDKLPSGIGAPAKAGTPKVEIDRGRDTGHVGGEVRKETVAEPETARHEAQGIKLSVQKSEANLNYEMEKAYNALLNGHTDAAIAIYRRVLDNHPDHAQALFGLATTYHRSGQVDMARPLYGRLLSLEPGNRDALNNFLVLLADEAPQEALDQLEKLEEKNPDFSPIPAQMAVIYQRLGDTDRASQKMFKAVALAPENLTYRYNLAILLDKQKKYDEAGRLYRQLVEAYRRGENIPGDIHKIQERLTFISSNRS